MPPDDNTDSDLTKIVEGMKVQAEQMVQLGGLIAGQAQSHQTLETVVTDLATAIKAGVPVVKPDELDFEHLETKDLFGHLMKAITEASEKTAEQLRTEISDLRSNIGKGKTTDALNALRDKKGNEDFDDWLPEMKELAVENPTLSVERLFGLAKLENPTKVAELVEKYKTDETREAERLAKEEKDGASFLSLTPTSSNPALETGEDKDAAPITIQDGVKKALAEVVPRGAFNET